MGIFDLPKEEKDKILEKHKKATNDHYLKKEETKKGLQKKEKKEKPS